MGFMKEFKEFAMRGNVIDMAVGVVIGGAFGKIVSSLVSDIVMPPLGILTGGMDFKDKVWTLQEGSGDAEAVVISYGAFISNVIDFVIIALVIFVVIKQVNRISEMMAKKEEAAPPDPTTKICEYCRSEIAIKATRCPQCTSQLS